MMSDVPSHADNTQRRSYRQLRRRSTLNGSSVAEIVRRAIDADEAEAGAREQLLASVRPSALTRDQRLSALEASRGVWADRGDEVYEQWRDMRGHDRTVGE